MSYVARHKGDRLRVQGVETPPPDDTERASLSGALHPDSPKDTWRAPLSGLPQGEAHGTRDHHTLDDIISYPDMLSGSLTSAAILSGNIFHGFQRTLLNHGLLW